MNPERSEKIEIEFKLSHEGYQKHAVAVASLCPFLRPDDSQPGDVLRVDYKFDINYYGRSLMRNLGYVEELLDDPAVVRDVKIQELNHGHSILLELHKKLLDIQARLGSN